MQRIFSILNVIRLALFAIGYGLTGALVGGTLNRVMVVDIGLPVSLVGLFFATPLFIAPLRAWVGYLSDAYPVLGKRREPYMIAGALVAGVGVILAILLLVNSPSTALLLAVGVFIAFLIHEFGRNLSHNAFQALLADKFTGNQRARAITLYEVATILGLTMGAGGIGRALETYDPGQLTMVTIGVSVITFVLALVAALGNEPRHDAAAEAVTTARSVPFTRALREIAVGDRQVRLFFVIIILTIIGTLAQDVLLEPYGALVMDMDVGDTTRLTAFWGLGVMTSMLLSGLLLIRFLGHMTTLRIGLVMTVIVFGGVIASGALNNTGLFRGLVLLMGLGTGLAGASLLTGMVNFTTRARAGLLMGMWGIAMVFGRAMGGLIGGTIVDVMQASGGSALIAYSMVFALEALLLVTALYLTTRLDVRAARAVEEEQGLQQQAGIGAGAVGL